MQLTSLVHEMCDSCQSNLRRRFWHIERQLWQGLAHSWHATWILDAGHPQRHGGRWCSLPSTRCQVKHLGSGNQFWWWGSSRLGHVSKMPCHNISQRGIWNEGTWKMIWLANVFQQVPTVLAQAPDVVHVGMNLGNLPKPESYTWASAPVPRFAGLSICPEVEQLVGTRH